MDNRLPEELVAMTKIDTHPGALQNWFPWVALLGVWTLIIMVVNPSGEFMVNDDWAFIKCLETFRATGTIAATGWGPPGYRAGPALLVHLLWGDLFCHIWGFSLTTLRVAVLTMGILGSFGLLLLLRWAGASAWLALLGTLTVVGNPLSLAEAFTYMTDITFASLVIFALLCFFLGVKKSRTSWIIAGLVLTLGSILTRQIGVAIFLAFILTSWLHPAGLALGRGKMVLLALGLVLLPWISFEVLLSRIGSSPFTQHEIIRQIFTIFKEKSFPGYLVFLGQGLFCYAIYAAFFISPLLINRFIFLLRRRDFRYLFSVFLVVVALGEGAIFTGLIHPPVIFLGNVIFNLGIGPILLKDTYILGIPRFGVISRGAYYLVVAWAALAVTAVLSRFIAYVGRRLRTGFSPEAPETSFLVCLSVLSMLFYLSVVMLTPFRDRYLIPLIIFLVIWMVSDYFPPGQDARTDWKIIPGFVLVIFLGLWSTCNVHDFMAMKRSLKQTHDYVLREMWVDPCTVDGGFEFNGYYCYKNDFRPGPGLSWWWVSREDYVITLGPLPGYRVLRIFPFQRYCGPPGAIHLLQPLHAGPPNG
jgi:hypothetical protein